MKTGGHDTAAALVDRDGTVIAAVSEERLDRVKHSGAFPRKAVLACLAEAKIAAHEIEGVYVPYRYGRAILGAGVFPALVHRKAKWRSAVRLARRLNNRRLKARMEFNELVPGVRPVSLDHHDCHATSAFLTSPFSEATVLTIDGRGERATARVYRGRDGAVTRLATFGNYPHSIGLLYSAITKHLGFQPNCEEGSVMALAAYGDSERFSTLFDRMLTYRDRRLTLDLGLFAHFATPKWALSDEFCRLTCEPRRAGGELARVHQDVAAALQAAVKRVVLAMVTDAIETAGSSRLCFAGGVALNSVVNGAIAAEPAVDALHVQSAPGDEGAALGAALLGRSLVVGEPVRGASLATPFLGPRYQDTDVERSLRSFVAAKPGYLLSNGDEAITRAVERLRAGDIVALFDGLSEYGPRALGNRSILADPSRVGVADELNERVKFREGFRPFAVSVLAEYLEQLFVGAVPTPNMSMAFSVATVSERSLAGVVHVDGTVRAQTVETTGPRLLRTLLERFHTDTRIPALVNTSFNVKGQPIVETASEALECLDSTGIDALLIGGRLIEKEVRFDQEIRAVRLAASDRQRSMRPNRLRVDSH